MLVGDASSAQGNMKTYYTTSFIPNQNSNKIETNTNFELLVFFCHLVVFERILTWLWLRGGLRRGGARGTRLSAQAEMGRREGHHIDNL